MRHVFTAGRLARLMWLLCWFPSMLGVEAPQDSLPVPVQISGVGNAFRVTDWIYSGSQPEGTNAFQALKSLGMTTLISVDGKVPDAEMAARHGLKYIHLPHGYDAIPRETELRLIKAVASAPGRVFVHCHHGKHRGPAAVGIICQSLAGWSGQQARTWLQQAGTSTDYPGLYESNERFQAPKPAELASISADFPVRSIVSKWVEAMVSIDHSWDQIRAHSTRQWKAGESGRTPSTWAKLMEEGFRELRRQPDHGPKTARLAVLLLDAETKARDLSDWLQSPPRLPESEWLKESDARFKSVGRTCTECHREFRN